MKRFDKDDNYNLSKITKPELVEYIKNVKTEFSIYRRYTDDKIKQIEDINNKLFNENVKLKKDFNNLASEVNNLKSQIELFSKIKA